MTDWVNAAPGLDAISSLSNARISKETDRERESDREIEREREREREREICLV